MVPDIITTAIKAEAPRWWKEGKKGRRSGTRSGGDNGSQGLSGGESSKGRSDKFSQGKWHL